MSWNKWREINLAGFWRILDGDLKMSDELERDVSNTVKAIEVGIEIGDLSAAFLRDQVYTPDPLKRNRLPDPAYEAEFIKKLEQQLDSKGLMPELLLEFARESFPAEPFRRRFVTNFYGSATDPNNFYMFRNDIRSKLSDTSGIRRMIYRNMSEHFGEINNFSPPSRWLFVDSITPKDIQKWATSQKKADH